jgi:hypothetical protein
VRALGAIVPLVATTVFAFAIGCDRFERSPSAPESSATAPAEDAAPESGAETATPDAAAASPQPEGTVRRTLKGVDGRTFEAEFGGEHELPSDFPGDVPLYGGAKPMSSMASVEYGTVVNLRTTDAPESVQQWYRQHFAEQGWEVEHEAVERGRIVLSTRKGNRVAAVVITGIPGFTQVLLHTGEDR